MPAYIHGNLAVEQKSGQKVSVKETKKVVYRNKTLPVQEKLLYLFTVVVCVVVASLIIWRYAQIYEMNTKILKLETEIQKLQAENSILKHKMDGLSSPDRLRQEATKMGMVPAKDNQISKVARPNSASPSGATAANQSKPE
ncbi:cell division protein FtsL [Paenibacillus doosanensis]|uniref:Cell division protein FtsL n=1 Tax=Paenibacillus konkukensis TaxID=2020716 RepID=A0ABY4RXG7_9BACL|nr:MULTISPECIES: cell division protein FtsL [Paenibacillus]MCS7459258.1 cell division protein FtsL [Paenibacillus doosanensis]UQZ87051.1 Cell division protein FtsL [Paenibacillus konkukensis]